MRREDVSQRDGATRRLRGPAASRVGSGLVLAAPALVALVAARSITDALHGSDLAAGAAVAWAGFVTTLLNPAYWALLAVLCVLQWRFPARPDQRGPSVAWAADFNWMVLQTALQVTVVAVFLGVLDRAYTDLAGGWSLDLEPVLGTWGLAVAAFVTADLLAWWTHWLHHRVPALWCFHAVHHSQTELNILSDYRQHVVETMVAAALSFVPARLLGLDAPAAATLAFLTIYVSAFIHANIRTNLGPLGYVFISPQAHRVHHSCAPEHIDTNFGTVFAFWDHLFGTVYHDRDDYPPTGIADREYPLETSANPLELAGSWCRQSVYPFRILARRSVTGYRDLVPDANDPR